jgi:glycerophosphoryl diester phosphodiesterase
MRVIAHRGANREAPENSLQAMQLAIDCGSDSIEFDVHVSADGIPFVLHDENLDRTTSGTGRIPLLSSAEIRRAKLKNNESVPSLADVLDLCRGKIAINAEIKSRTAEETATICEFLHRHWGSDQLIISSFQPLVIHTVAQDFPNLPRACLIEPSGWSWPSFADTMPLNFMNANDTKILHPEASMIDQNMMDQAKNRGWIVNAWYPMRAEMIHREEHWAILYHLGVDGVCTNYPRQMRQWLNEVAEQEREFAS